MNPFDDGIPPTPTVGHPPAPAAATPAPTIPGAPPGDGIPMPAEAGGLGAAPPETPDERRHRLLYMLSLMLGVDRIGRTVVRLEQDGDDPDDAVFSVHLDDGTDVQLGPVAVLMQRAKVQQAIVVRLGCSTTRMKPAEWQDNLADVIAGAVTKRTSAVSLHERVADWLDQYLLMRPPLAYQDRNEACVAREPFVSQHGDACISLGAFAKFASRVGTELVSERRIASVLRDMGWASTVVAYQPLPDDRRRTTCNYWQAPSEHQVPAPDNDPADQLREDNQAIEEPMF